MSTTQFSALTSPMPLAVGGVPIRLDATSAGMLLTPDEFDAVAETDENYRYELIRGVLIVNPLPLKAESSPNQMLGHWLLTYKFAHPQGSVLDDTLNEQHVRVRDGRRRPDRCIWTGIGRVANDEDVPTIVIEFVSESRRDQRRDYIEKRSEYREAGIREYWIIDRFRRTMTVVQNTPDGERELLIAEHENYHPDLLPGFELPLGKLLAVADQYGPKQKQQDDQ